MFRFLTSGESHGPGLTIIVEGIPAGVPLTEGYIAEQLARRQRGYGRGGRMKIETDFAEIRGGVRHGETLGSPVGMAIQNKDFANWQGAMDVGPVGPEVDQKENTRVVPGHADFPGALKYMAHDMRNVLERASARETAARVAAGAVARAFLDELGIEIHSRVVSVGSVTAPDTPSSKIDWEVVEECDVRTDDPETAEAFRAAIDASKADRTTIGGVFQVVAEGVPVGLGSHIQWDRKLDGMLAQAMMSINAVKGVEIGHGFTNTRRPGREVHDVVVPAPDDPRRFRQTSNEAGGIEGGMSNGNPIVVHVAIKPIATMTEPLPSVDINTGEVIEAPYHRSDICQVPPACVIGEAMMAQVLALTLLEKFGGDHITETRRNLDGYVASHQEFGQPASAPGGDD
ncbi:MAG: chorismate synthase [Dehalococcoidia bacterium]|nr:chorismate synthase [Dehalococcoidia bacterium]